MLPNAGLRPVGERWSSPSPRRTSTMSGRIMWSAYEEPPKSTGDESGVPRPCTAPYGEWSAWTLSKSSGTALILIIRSRSSAVRRLILALLVASQYAGAFSQVRKITYLF